ncbi:hypothetical protein Nepgr_014079 [Nepenthes gracilis]|uniref:Uncharacterized protein n=1 Tax=Nepenthes gracilis TaxID=150966 RepID=A0AAD3XPI8_NEPGR|nr:hypothetical protein Nepgr_014079 [Nepenthes gracilis]
MWLGLSESTRSLSLILAVPTRGSEGLEWNISSVKKGSKREEQAEEVVFPDVFGGGGIFRSGDEAVVGTEPEDGVRLAISVAPVNVFQLLSGDNGYVQI